MIGSNYTLKLSPNSAFSCKSVEGDNQQALQKSDDIKTTLKGLEEIKKCVLSLGNLKNIDSHLIKKIIVLLRKNENVCEVIQTIFKNIFRENHSQIRVLDHDVAFVSLSQPADPNLFWDVIYSFLENKRKVKILVINTGEEICFLGRPLLTVLFQNRPLSLNFSLKEISLFSSDENDPKEKLVYPQIVLKKLLGVEGDIQIKGLGENKMPTVKQAKKLLKQYLSCGYVSYLKGITLQNIEELERFFPKKMSDHFCPPNHLSDKLKRDIHSINKYKKKIRDFKFTKDDLFKVAPYLTYVNLEKISLQQSDLDQLIKSCKRAEEIVIQSDKPLSIELPKSVKKVVISAPNIEKLILPKTLEEAVLKDCEKLTDLHVSEGIKVLCIERCYQLQQLKVPKTVKECICRECINLNNLILFEGLKKLICFKNFNLKKLTLPNTLKELNCSCCIRLEKIVVPKRLKKIICKECVKLKELILTKGVEEVDCSSCASLSSLIVPDGAKRVVCENCKKLQTLSLPQSIETLLCKGCPSLTTLGESLPYCTKLDCSLCKQLHHLPKLPINAQVNTSLDWGHFSLSFDDLNENPIDVLLRLGKEVLLKGKPFPRKIFFDFEDRGETGVKSHLISFLMKNLLTQEELFIDFEEKKLPILSPKEKFKDKQIVFKSIGKILAFCLSTPNFFIGPCFPTSFFNALFILKEFLQKDSLETILKEKRSEIYCVLKKIDKKNVVLEESLFEYIDNEPVVFPLLLIASEMYTDYIREVIKKNQIKNPHQLQQAIEGDEITADKLLQNIDWQDDRLSNNIKQHFERWVKSEEKSTLETFMLFVTGGRSIGSEKIKIEVKEESEYLPVAHTCIKTVEIPNYSSFETFKNKMQLALTASKGFQIR